MGLFIVAALSFSFGLILASVATAHPLLLSGSARGIFLVVLCSILCEGERGLLGHGRHFQSFLNVNCTLHCIACIPFQYSFDSVIKQSLFLSDKFQIDLTIVTIFKSLKAFLTKPFHQHKVQNSHLKIVLTFYSTNTN